MERNENKARRRKDITPSSKMPVITPEDDPPKINNNLI